MKTLVIYYSYGGSTRCFAEAAAKEEGADLYEVKDRKRAGMLGTFFVGCPRAILQSLSPVQPITADLSAYDKIIIMAPIWANHPAPAINNVFAMLPAGKQVALRMVSSGGSSAKDKVSAMVKAKGCDLVEYTDIKSSAQAGES